jgi:hypothetical protein
VVKSENIPQRSSSPSSEEADDDEDGYYTASRSVGPKVTTARLIRDRVGDGCRICALGRQVENANATVGA